MLKAFKKPFFNNVWLYVLLIKTTRNFLNLVVLISHTMKDHKTLAYCVGYGIALGIAILTSL